MSEEEAAPDTGGLALDLAMEEARSDPSLRGHVAAFLTDQRALIAVQKHHLLKQFAMLLWEKRLSVLLRVATMVMGLVVAGGLGFMIWNAAHSNGLLIEPFNVPRDLAARGLTGQVVAAKLQDRLAAMQAQTNSGRPAKSYANSWGEHGIKLDIPETGISISELDGYLREKLGHDTHVSGEIVRKAAGLALSARAGDQSAPAVIGQEEDIDALVQTLAESVYRITQPFRYGMFLAGHARNPEALPVFEALAKGQDKEERMWGYARWALTVDLLRGSDAAFPLERQALAEDSDNIGVYDSLANYYGSKGRSEEGLQNGRAQLTHLLNGRQTYVSPALIPGWEAMLKARINGTLGAYHDAAEDWEGLVRTGLRGLPGSYLRTSLVISRINEHDLAAGRTALAEINSTEDARFLVNLVGIKMNLARQAEDWRLLLAIADTAIETQKSGSGRNNAQNFGMQRAVALARLGRFDAAQAQVAASNSVCYPCLRARAAIADLQGQPARADYWFARLAAAGPSLPFAEFDWGQALLKRGAPDAAIEKFQLANRKSPHFADPLEYWGEALMAKNQSHLALEKFAEAEKYAPNWGRLHLKWGEALAYAGKPADAKAQFARAAALDLTPSEKSELGRQPHG